MSSSSNSEWWARAQRVMPSGVNSPVRAFKSVEGEPRFFAKAAGSSFVDEDGRAYIDYCQSWGPLILGHADPDVLDAVRAAAAEGLSFGAPSRREVLLAEAFLERVGVYDQVRFVSSGTEAVMSAIRLARGATGRDLVVKFNGCYHGHVDSMLVSAGSGLATFGTPSSAGVPDDFSKHTLVLPLDDEDALAALFEAHGSRIAALIMEPVPANAGLLVQRPEMVQRCRELCTAHGAMLIFDEVITGFRVHRGGASAYYGIEPDIGTFGKIVGGGMPVGAYAARSDVMRHISPAGPVYQAGTLSGNPVAMAAGLATLEKIGRPGFYEALEERAARLCAGFEAILEGAGVPASVVRVASIFWVTFQPEAPRRYEDVDAAGVPRYRALHRALLERGVYLAPSAYEVGFVSAAHTDADVDRTLVAFEAAVAEMTG